MMSETSHQESVGQKEQRRTERKERVDKLEDAYSQLLKQHNERDEIAKDVFLGVKDGDALQEKYKTISEKTRKLMDEFFRGRELESESGLTSKTERVIKDLRSAVDEKRQVILEARNRSGREFDNAGEFPEEGDIDNLIDAITTVRE